MEGFLTKKMIDFSIQSIMEQSNEERRRQSETWDDRFSHRGSFDGIGYRNRILYRWEVGQVNITHQEN
jgi:hypothetical protein